MSGGIRHAARRVTGILLLSATVILGFTACGGSVPEEVGGFWFFRYDGRGESPDGTAFAYVTADGPQLGGGVASDPLGGPLFGRLDGNRLSITLRDVGGEPVVEATGQVRGSRARGNWSSRGDGEANGSFRAVRFDPDDTPPAENPFLGTWNNFADGGETTLIFGADYRFTGSEGDLDFSGLYAFSETLGLVGVYEADGESVHMEKLTYRFEDPETVVLNGSVYRLQEPAMDGAGAAGLVPGREPGGELPARLVAGRARPRR